MRSFSPWISRTPPGRPWANGSPRIPTAYWGRPWQVSPETLLSLLNTVYFRSEWMSAFQESATAPGVFHNGDGTESQCDFMNKTMDGSFFRNDVFTAASLSLKSGAVTFLLPGEGLRPSDVLASPSWEALVKDQLESTGYGEVVLKVPKLDYSDSLDLLDAAKALGHPSGLRPYGCGFQPLMQRSSVRIRHPAGKRLDHG